MLFLDSFCIFQYPVMKPKVSLDYILPVQNLFKGLAHANAVSSSKEGKSRTPGLFNIVVLWTFDRLVAVLVLDRAF